MSPLNGDTDTAVATTSTNVCAYCGHSEPCWFTGRRWLCSACYREHMGEAP